MQSSQFQLAVSFESLCSVTENVIPSSEEPFPSSKLCGGEVLEEAGASDTSLSVEVSGEEKLLPLSEFFLTATPERILLAELRISKTLSLTSNPSSPPSMRGPSEKLRKLGGTEVVGLVGKMFFLFAMRASLVLLFILARTRTLYTMFFIELTMFCIDFTFALAVICVLTFRRGLGVVSLALIAPVEADMVLRSIVEQYSVPHMHWLAEEVLSLVSPEFVVVESAYDLVLSIEVCATKQLELVVVTEAVKEGSLWR